jgi:hypothetical protein
MRDRRELQVLVASVHQTGIFLEFGVIIRQEYSWSISAGVRSTQKVGVFLECGVLIRQKYKELIRQEYFWRFTG